MVDCAIPSSRKSRLIRRGLMICGWGLVAVMVYVASIGPLVWLNSCGFGSNELWKQLHKTVYRPVFYVWWHGPRWGSDALGWYADLFHGSTYGNQIFPYFTKRYNKQGRLARIRYHFDPGEELTDSDGDELSESAVVFSLGEADYDLFLFAHAATEFQR